MPRNRYRTLRIACLLAFVWGGTAIGLRAEEPPLDFNRDIRPILSENCFYCHGQDPSHREADLRLDLRESAIELGAIVPHDPEASQLIERVLSDDDDMRMPPAGSNRHLSDKDKQLLKRWIAEGAEFEKHWAFVTPQRPELPEEEGAPQDGSWARNPIDHFVLDRLRSEGLEPSPEADRETLIKRLSIDLVGLPPTPEEIEAFVSDPSDDAYEQLVERLLASEHYGERMALPWLDAARYADSNGFQQDGDTWQWIWRDWVVKALNEDLPFDQFTIWQLAGDLLPEATTEQKIASGFNRNHLLNGEGGAIAEEQRWVILFDRMETTSTTWLGLTMSCAQCHDHKYDPITQRDFYRMLDAFNRVPESGTPQFFSSRIRVAAPFIELPTEENKAHIADLEAKIAAADAEVQQQSDEAYQEWRAEISAEGQPAVGDPLPEPLIAIYQKAEDQRTEEEQKSLAEGLRKHFDEKVRPAIKDKIPALATAEQLRNQLSNYRGDKLPRVMVMSDERPRETRVLDRGEYLSPTDEKVSFGTPEFLPPLAEDAPQNRLGLAQWLVSDEHPLTARVQVNRMWQHFFGTGIVKTSEDFGVQSEYPIHGDLLDWLAVEFREKGWSMKHIHRLIVSSATYRQSSRVSPELLERDRENRLFARASRMRMPSPLLRDWALASADLLDRRVGGAPVYPYQPDDVWEALAITKERDFTYPASSGTDLYRRSLYTFWRRTVGPANMFDTSNRQACRVRAETTSTPLHALTTLNDPTWVEAARVLARQSWQAGDDLDTRLTAAFRRVTCRAPADNDLALLKRAYEKQHSIYAADTESALQLLAVGESPRDASLDSAEHAALTAVCLAILNLDESLTRQ